jgi:2,6-dihydroxypyridine 3-monooxygenase
MNNLILNLATIEPFMQTIFDLSVPKMAFGRVCILGDAAFVPRPHTAASTSKAATNAMALANSITNSSNVNVIEALKRWEPSQLELGNYLKYLGVSLGNRSQFNQT